MKNEYTIQEDTVIIHVLRRNGDKFDVYIDVEDLPLIEDFGYSIYVSWKENVKGYYAQMTIYKGIENGKIISEVCTLQRLITNAKPNEIVDHKNHNTLDNKRNNLRVTVNDKNTKNRAARNTNNTTGYRNVSFADGRYIVQLQINGKNKRLKSFTDVHEAGKYAAEMRKKYYGDFAGDN